LSGSWPDGYGRQILPSTDSTMAEAARQAPVLPGPAWILARHQSAARGRRGRAWAMPEGNFAASLVLRPEAPAAEVALRSFVAALALYDAFAAVTGRTEPFALKWPNDVLLNGGKVAGILLESAGQGGRVETCIIGFGVNLAAAPPADAVEEGALRPVSLLHETGIAVTPEEFLDALAPAYAQHEARYAAQGFAPIRAAWLDRAARLGETITARTMRERYEGRFESIDEAGNLILATGEGRLAIPAADIYF